MLLLSPLSPAASDEASAHHGSGSDTLTVLPDDGRVLYEQVIDAARQEIRIEICVLEDPDILARIQAALGRGVRVRAIVDRGKYGELASEQANLGRYLTDAGGELHLSNPVFPRSFPKIILIDAHLAVYGSACLDETTFKQYRDFAHTLTDQRVLRDLQRLFENDWAWSSPPKADAPAFNPTPPIESPDLIVSPVNAAARLVALYQQARATLDVYTELLGNPTLDSELVAAVRRGVRVRLITPSAVNGATPPIQALQDASIAALAAAGVAVHVSGPGESAQAPYMHARAAIVDGETAYLGSDSHSPDSIAFNREAGIILRRHAVVRELAAQFESDYRLRSKPY